MKLFGQIVAAVVYVTTAAMWSGYVLSILWRWFIVSQFDSAPHLSVPAAMGIAMIVSYLVKDFRLTLEQKEIDATERLIHDIVVSFALPALALFFGWIVSMFL